MFGKILKNILKGLFSPKSYIWVVLLLSLIWLIIWFQEHRLENQSEDSHLQIEWKKENSPLSSDEIDNPLLEKNDRISDLKHRSNKLLDDYRHKMKTDSPKETVENLGKEKENLHPPASSVKEMDMHQPIQYEKSLKNPSDKPKVILIFHGLGLDPELVQKASTHLDPSITFTFIPYGQNLDKDLLDAQINGHELLMAIPMESLSYPQDDPGSKALLTGLSPQENKERLHWALDKAKPCVGVCNYFGSHFTAVEADLKPILEEVKKSGFLFLYTKAGHRSQVELLSNTIGLPNGICDVLVRLEESHDDFIDKLGDLIEIAHEEGSAIGVIEASPHRLDQLIEWQNSMEKDEGFDLVPLTTVIEEPDQTPTRQEEALSVAESSEKPSTNPKEKA